MIEFLTGATPNGWKVAILLEELGLPYEVRRIDFEAREQHAPWFLALNPNGRIPVIIDHGNENLVLAESGAILWYLAERHGRFLPRGGPSRFRVLQWLMFQMSGLGPMMGQAAYFQRILEPKGVRVDVAIDRYIGESRRLLEVLDRQLATSEYVAGEYSIADIALYPWARAYPWSKVHVNGLGHLQRWFACLEAREAVRVGCKVPEAIPAAFGLGDDVEAVSQNVRRFGAPEKG